MLPDQKNSRRRWWQRWIVTARLPDGFDVQMGYTLTKGSATFHASELNKRNALAGGPQIRYRVARANV